MRVKVGCCGFSLRSGRAAYYRVFRLVEVQSTFYKLPRVSTAERWRREAPEDFEFTVKCWQAVTHPPTSPTWRKAGIKVEKEKYGRYGMLKPTEENFEAWNKTMEICRALNARICLIQCPPRFRYTEENVENMKAFLNSIKRDRMLIAWEPRGDWPQHREEAAELCRELNLVYVTDILRHEPIITGNLVYTRLHGLNPREYDYRYKYTDEDLQRLIDGLRRLEDAGVEEVYVLFNNTEMGEDAQRFLGFVRDAGWSG